MADNSRNTANQEVNSTNIFDEFNTDNQSLADEVQKLKNELNKDTYYYIQLSWKILVYIFWLLLFLLWIAYAYIFVQNNENMVNKSYLDPVCKFLLWDTPAPSRYLSCSSIASTKTYYNNNLNELKKDQTEKLLPLLSVAYEQENFLKSKEIIFLLDKSDNKFRVLDILERFDKIKNNFWWFDKRKIQCNNISLNSETSLLSMKCEAYSMWFERWIIWFSWDNSVSGWDVVWWTSISVANSFLNFIERTTNDFTLVNRQRIFSSTNVSWEQSGYTNKTSFDVTLKINF